MSKTWVMLEKDGQIYKYILYDNTHVFNRDLMDIQIEGWNPDVFLTYDDIVCVRTHDYHTSIRRIDELPPTLTDLYIRSSNITDIPVFQPDVKSIQLYGTNIEEPTSEQQDELRRLYPRALIAIDSLAFMFKKQPVVQPREYQGYTRGYDSDENSDYSDDDYSQYSYRGSDDDNNLVGTYTELNHPLDTDQTVHLTSINHTVLQSIQILREKSQEYPQVLKPIHLLFENEEEGDNTGLRSALREWRDQTQKVHQITFGELFHIVMTLVDGHPNEEIRENMKQRVLTELREAIGMCFMGRINRLVSSMVGFVEGVTVGVSVKEELQMKILLIVKNWTDKRIDGKQARRQMKTLFENVGEEDGITDYFKQENLSALDDLIG